MKSPVDEFARVIQLVKADELSSTNSKIVLEKLVFEGGKTDEWIISLGLKQSNDLSALEIIADQVLSESHSQVIEYQNGKVNLF